MPTNTASPAALECAEAIRAAVAQRYKIDIGQLFRMEVQTIIDARVRPLVESLEAILDCEGALHDDGLRHDFRLTKKQALEQARAALSQWR